MLPQLRRLVCRLQKALYRHPNAGTYSEQKCDAHVKSVGFVPISPEWPSCYFNPNLTLMVVAAYVDDFKMVRPNYNIRVGWKLLRQVSSIERSKGLTRNVKCTWDVDSWSTL